MSQITIQCRLVATESARQQMWRLMAEINTPLINELLAQVGQHPDFEQWRQKGKLPSTFISQLSQSFKSDPRFLGQPSRFYKSAFNAVEYIYKSWLALNKRLQQQLDRKRRWLEILQSDTELAADSNCSLDAIRSKAAEILSQAIQAPSLDSSPPRGKKGKKSKGRSSSSPVSSLFANLFKAYQETDDIKCRCAISYLLKNNCQLSDREEDPEKFAKRRRKVEIRIQRLTEKLNSRMPNGRDLTNTRWLETLAIATTSVPQDEAQARQWQDVLLTKPKSLPFPLIFETNEDLFWSKNQQDRLCVHFPGLRDLAFQVYCDRRQLHWFHRFLEDQQTKHSSKNQHSSSLFTLRSAYLAWQQGKEKGEPWNTHYLILYCCVDTRLWTAEGTELVRQEKTAEIEKVINRTKAKNDLTETQQAFIQRQKSTLARIKGHFDRPSQSIYQGQSHILVGVSLGLDKPATVAVVDAIAEKVLAYRNTRQLLGDNYKLLNRQRRQQRSLSHKRHKAQKRADTNQFGESELGQYVERLLAKEIVAISQNYRAGSIVLPKLGDMQEILTSEIQARAEAKCPNYVEGQQKYAKQYRISIHKWSYGRLMQNIQSQAAQAEIVVEEGKQLIRGSPQEMAKELAIAAYQSRQPQ
ncbi:type V CRISPR-associated protein Cas12k [Scytonema millei]|uniref:Uncharacterized protein n=1 Tax=Scytonema millei VB511283 TaxID=1245923 RepID=A0A9X5I5R8_9CYAN|nr:type V CRISPR-associated protein Cas12k [Scytonema millei]NHC36883.1 hypothetical protein [Scytonema millei VB511283]